MVDYFVDYEGGSDGSAGTSFATRKKTISSAATAAAAGDTIRVMASPAPTDTGQSATFTNKSVTVTLTSAVTKTITDCETAWTASSGVTSTTSTTVFMQGTRSANLVIAAGYNFAVTPIVAYFDTGSLDLSAYRQITFRFRSTVDQAASTFAIRLSTTTGGTTSTHQVTLTRAMNDAQWLPIVVDTGGAMNGAILSVAVIALSAPALGTLNVDNIEAAKAPGDVDAITHLSLIGKNSAGETWWTIAAIKDTTITIGHVPRLSTNANSKGYWGVTESVTLYKRETIKTDYLAARGTNANGFTKLGTEGSYLTISGGWNRTDMSDQVGFDGTYFDGVDGYGVGLGWASTSHYSRVTGLSFYRYTTPWRMDAQYSRLDNSHSGSMDLNNGLNLFGGTTSGPTYLGTALPIWFHSAFGAGFNMAGRIGTFYIVSNDGGVAFNFSSGASSSLTDTIYICNNDQTGLSCSSSRPDIRKAVIKDNGTAGVYLRECDLLIRELDSSGNIGEAIHSERSGILTVYNATIADATPYTSSNPTSGYINYGGHAISINEVSPSSSPLIVRHNYGVIQQATDQTFLGTYSWKHSVTNTNCKADFPLSWLLTAMYVPAGGKLNFACKARRDSSNITARIRIKGGSGAGYNGIAADLTSAVVGINAWEDLGITVTPTASGIVEVWMETYGGTTNNAWFDGPIRRTVD